MVSTTAILCVLSSLIALGSSCTVKSTSYTTEGMLFLLIIQTCAMLNFSTFRFQTCKLFLTVSHSLLNFH